MSNSQTPAFLQDSAQLLSQKGFKTSNTWYHGTASGLIDSISEKGLKSSGDVESRKKAKSTMATIGDSYKERKDPIFLTQSKELAYFWAQSRTQSRNSFFAQGETPVVLAVTLSDEFNSNVKTDVGGAALIMSGSDEFLDSIKAIYESNNLTAPEIDPISADRMDYLNLLGLAYCKQNISTEFIEVLKEN